MGSKEKLGSSEIIPPWDVVDHSDRIDVGTECFIVAPITLIKATESVHLPLAIVKTRVVAQIIGQADSLKAYQVQWWVNHQVPGRLEYREIHPGKVHATREAAEAVLEARWPSILSRCREGVTWHFPGNAM